MKMGLKVMAVAVALGLVSVVGARADSTNVSTNALGQVVTAITSDMGTTTTIAPASTPTASKSGEAPAFGSQISVGHIASGTTTNTAFTPRGFGDILIGSAGGTACVWMAVGPTTNDWVKVGPNGL